MLMLAPYGVIIVPISELEHFRMLRLLRCLLLRYITGSARAIVTIVSYTGSGSGGELVVDDFIVTGHFLRGLYKKQTNEIVSRKKFSVQLPKRKQRKYIIIRGSLQQDANEIFACLSVHITHSRNINTHCTLAKVLVMPVSLRQANNTFARDKLYQSTTSAITPSVACFR